MKTESVLEDFGRIKAEYKAAAPSRTWRTRTGLGGRADSHLTQQQYWTLREYSRDMDRNDSLVGQMVDRAADNIIGEGLRVEPMTGDTGLNAELKSMFYDWGNDPRQCNSRGIFTFADMERLIYRHRIFDGDIFALPLIEGCVQLVEGDRCVTPTNTKRNVVHGVWLDDYERAKQFWFTKQKRFDWRIQNVGDVDPYNAYDEDGNPAVFHSFDAKRVTQTRGVPAFKAVYDLMTMFEDLNLAKLVQAQVVSCIGLFIERDKEFKGGVDAQIGPRTTEVERDDSTTATLEKMRPGLIIKGRKGEKALAFSPAVPNTEYFDHVRMLLRIVGANIGIPLTLVLLDTSDTTFHGYRGELNEARKGFKFNRKLNAQQFNTPVYGWKVRQWLKERKLSAAALKLEKSGVLFRHKWIGEGWPYIDPETDSKADVLVMKSMLDSPRGVLAKQGKDFDDVRTETIEDNGNTIVAAMKKAAEIKAAHPKESEDLTWRDVLEPMNVERILSNAKDKTAKAASQTSANAGGKQP